MGRRLLVSMALLLVLHASAYSQACTALGQTPASAFPVCGNTTFNQTSVGICGSLIMPNPCNDGFDYLDKNPYWYKFTCYVGGTLGFLIAPLTASSDYDWQLFDITGRNPNDVFTDPALFVACNWSGTTGNTGASTAGTGMVNCAGGSPVFSAMPTLIAGHEYLLMISHFTNSQSGYRLSFGGGSAVITDPNVPRLRDATPNCDGTRIGIRLNRGLKCNSLAANGTDFVISPAGIIASAVGEGCSSSFDHDSITLIMTSPLPAGTYTITSAIGSDGNTLLDNCDVSLATGETASFTIQAPVPLPMGTVGTLPCAPNTLTINFADPINCNSIAANGSDFVVTGPAAVTVTGATFTCTGTQTTAITLQLSAPITTPGNYQVQTIVGNDGNTLLGTCSRPVPVGAVAPFNIAAQTPVAMPTVGNPSCAPTTLLLTFSEPINCTSIVPNGSDFTITGPSGVTVIGAVGSCNVSPTSQTIQLTLSAPITVPGNYQVVAAIGSDGNSITGNCLRSLTPGDVAPFTIAAQAPVAMGTIANVGCAPTSVVLTFAESIQCNSIAPNGSDFTVSGPSGVTILTASATPCNAAGETNAITLTLSAPITTPGNYQILAANGSDGNTVLGNCFRAVTVGDAAPFTVQPQLPLPMGTASNTSCSPTSVTLTFPEPVLCATIAGDGSDFTITGPTPVTIISAGPTCNAAAETSTITITFAGPVNLDGIYQIQVNTGNDGNTLMGNCVRSVPVGTVTNFNVPVAPPVTMTSVAPVACSPTSIRINLSGLIICGPPSIAPDGSDFIITGPSAVTINSAAGAQCAGLYGNAIDLQLASPIVVGGVYTIQLVTGTDGTTLVSDCFRQSPAGSTITFTAADTVSARFTYTIQSNCTTSDINLTHPGGNGINSWSWTVNGTAAGTQPTQTQTVPATSSTVVQLTVSNGVCSDTHSETIQLNNRVDASFTALPASICPEDSVVLVNTSEGPITSWQWSFGNSQTSNVRDPLPVHYPQTGVESNYTISLTVSDANGCQDVATVPIKVFATCIIAVPSAFTPNNDGRNDFFYPLNAFKAVNLDFRVYNRWGQIVFQTNDWSRKWNGTVKGIPQASDVYVWTLRYKDRDTGQEFNLRGTTMLIR